MYCVHVQVLSHIRISRNFMCLLQSSAYIAINNVLECNKSASLCKENYRVTMAHKTGQHYTMSYPFRITLYYVDHNN